MGDVTAIVSAYRADPGWTADRLINLQEQEPRPQIIVAAQAGSYEAEEAAQTPGDNITVITTPDIPTIYSAWNACILQAKTDYITNANTDDRLYPGALEKLAARLSTHPADVVYSYVDKVARVDGPAIGQFTWATGGLATLLRGDFIGPMPMWRRRLHDVYGYFDDEMSVAGDYEYWLKLAYHGRSFSLIPEALGAYLVNPNSAETRNPQLTAWETARARSRYSLKKLWAGFENYLEGERVYVLGNGPSLNDVPILRLSNSVTFGSNRIYLRYYPTFLVAVNPLVLEQWGDEIGKYNSIRSGYEIDTTYRVPSFKRPYEPMWEGYTVTYVSLQIAYYMGAKEVILFGLDHDYGQLPGAPNSEMEMDGPDKGHFDPNYFMGARWNVPDLLGSEQAYRLARQIYEADDRRIINASTKTACSIFERGRMEDYI